MLKLTQPEIRNLLTMLKCMKKEGRYNFVYAKIYLKLTIMLKDLRNEKYEQRKQNAIKKNEG